MHGCAKSFDDLARCASPRGCGQIHRSGGSITLLTLNLVNPGITGDMPSRVLRRRNRAEVFRRLRKTPISDLRGKCRKQQSCFRLSEYLRFSRYHTSEDALLLRSSHSLDRLAGCFRGTVSRDYISQLKHGYRFRFHTRFWSWHGITGRGADQNAADA